MTILKTGANVFLTGGPGSGKTYVVNQYVNYLKERRIDPAITASTGIAATHLGGMTIHAWSGLGARSALDHYALDKLTTNETVSNRIRRARVLIIDEVSMLSAETLESVEEICRTIRQETSPFGGLQVVLVGDLFQLPPVKPKMTTKRSDPGMLRGSGLDLAYQSRVWRDLDLVVCYLTEQYRQKDHSLTSVLSAIRKGAFSDNHFEILNGQKASMEEVPERAPKLFTHNLDVDRINNDQLRKLKDRGRVFEMRTQGRANLVAGLKRGCLSPENLVLKIDAIVMFTKNDFSSGFVNGTLGRVIKFNSGDGLPVVKTNSGKIIKVEPMDWTVEEFGVVKARINQLPLRLAWAITVHKSQGMSLDSAAMDLSGVFEFGQGYVALSRIRSLSGLYLLGWRDRAAEVHPEVLMVDETWQEQSEKAAAVFDRLGAAELKRMQDNFLRASGGLIYDDPLDNDQSDPKKKNQDKREPGNTLAKTLFWWRKKKSISEVASIRGLKKETILGHIEKMSISGQIDRKELMGLLDPELNRAFPEIESAFRSLGTDKLLPVFKQLGGRYTYYQIRLVRLIMSRARG